MNKFEELRQRNSDYGSQSPFHSRVMNNAFASIDYHILNLEERNKELYKENQALRSELFDVQMGRITDGNKAMTSTLALCMGMPINYNDLGPAVSTMLIIVRETLSAIKDMDSVKEIRAYIEERTKMFEARMEETIGDA